MTNSEARKRMQDRSGPESPLSSPHTANLGDGANGRLSEAERAELLDAGLGRKFRMNALQMLIVERIVREHTERALADVEQRIASSVSPNFALRYDGSEDPQAAAYVEGLHDAHEIVRAARQERDPK